MADQDEDDLTGRINGWRCDTCGRHTYCVLLESGVTPMFLACRAEGLEPQAAACKGTATSLMFPPDKPPPHVVKAVAWEWYRPTHKNARRQGPDVLEHVEKGGLLLRPLTDAGEDLLARTYV